MPARDIFHNTVRYALEKDGWVITDDPLTLDWGDRNLFVDLAAERLVAAEKAGRKIAVEIKSFNLFVDDVGALALEDYALSIIVFNEQKEEIIKWIA
jgi:hypothetical protein